MLFDRIIALVGLVILSPVLAIVAAAVRLTSPGPAFFLQTRVGRGGRPFRIVKYRTMTVAPARPDERQVTVGGDRRITPLGAFLRRYKLDEIPQLFNVLAGQMRLVGPRPEVPRYVAFYTEEQRRALDVPPGITDAATLYYRNEADELAERADPERYYIDVILRRKLDLNRRYLERRTIWRDLGVVFLTAWVAISPRRGAERVRRSIERRYLSDVVAAARNDAGS